MLNVVAYFPADGFDTKKFFCFRVVAQRWAEQMG